MRRAAAAALVLAAVDAAVASSLAGSPHAWIPAHVLLSVLFGGVYGRVLEGRAPEGGARLLGGALALAVPGAGMPAALLLALLVAARPPAAGDVLADFKDHVGVPGLAKGTRPSGRGALEAAREAEPLIDMLASPDWKTKRAALETIANLRIPALLPQLSAALDDPRPEIYQFAMSLLTKLQGEHTGDIARAAEAVRTQGGAPQARRALAAACARYLDSTLADQSVYGFYEDMMRRELLEVVRQCPEDAASWGVLGGVALRAGRFEECRESYAKALAASADQTAARYGLAELAYELGDFQAMRRELAALGALPAGEAGAPDPRVAAARWWLSPGVEDA